MKYTLRAIRVNKGDTQEETAKAVGVSVDTWANYEKGKTFPDVPVIQRIEKYFNIPYDNIDFLCSDNTVKQ